MFPYPLNLIKSSKGLSVISIIILIAFIIGVLNLYAYFNPDFQLSKYTVVYIIRDYKDKQKKKDLDNIKIAVEKYYNETKQYPASDGWCGRIYSVLYSDVNEALSPYFDDKGVPQDPSFGGTDKDYFYIKFDRRSYALMAVLENPPAGSPTYNYEACHDWPGDGVYNYKIEFSR